MNVYVTDIAIHIAASSAEEANAIIDAATVFDSGPVELVGHGRLSLVYTNAPADEVTEDDVAYTLDGRGVIER